MIAAVVIKPFVDLGVEKRNDFVIAVGKPVDRRESIEWTISAGALARAFEMNVYTIRAINPVVLRPFNIPLMLIVCGEHCAIRISPHAIGT